jgi:hypothetical protein
MHSLTFFKYGEKVVDRLAFHIEKVLNVESLMTGPSNGQVCSLTGIQQIDHLTKKYTIMLPVNI